MRTPLCSLRPIALLALLTTSCSPMPAATDSLPVVRSHPWHHTRHHTERGFTNIWGEDEDPPFLKAAAWGVSFLLRSKEQRPAPYQPLDPASLAAPPEGIRLSWLGHSTVLLQFERPEGPLNILTDPIFADRASPLSFAGPKREVPLPLDPADLPPIDLVLLSHDHYDHLDLAGIRFLHERDRTLWASWYLEPLDASAPTVYYAGDTGYAEHFADVREHFGAPDLAIVPVGAYEPRWFMARVHVDPDEALQAYEDLGGPAHGTHFVAVHWGTFDLADDPLGAPRRLIPERAAARGLDVERIHVLDVGGQVLVP